MHIPSTDETIKRLMSAGSNSSTVERSRMKDGQPLFTMEDVANSRNSLDVELRYIFQHFEMGKSYFNDKSVEYYQKVEGHSRDKAKSDTQNLIRTLEKGNITDNRFEESIRVLGFEIIDRSVTIRDEIGNTYTFSSSQALKDAKKHLDAQSEEDD